MIKGNGEDVTMDLEQTLQLVHGVEAICGYVRNPQYHVSTETITGRCCLTGYSCERYLPMSMVDCHAYKKLLEK